VTSNDAVIRYEAAHKAATVTLADPDRRNALSTALIAQLREDLARAVADDAVRVIVIDHDGPVFCAGADLDESARATRAADLPAAHLAGALADICEAPKPVVAVARGAVRGGGMGLLAAADVSICKADASLAFSEVRLGVVPAVIGPVVARRLPPGRTRELFLLGEPFSGEVAAAHYGLVSRSCEDVDAERDAVVSALVQGGPSALAGVKELTADADLRSDLDRAAAVTAEYFFADEGREGVQAFARRGRPGWIA
jgi:methylglutaconyl-CoA hydratase